MLTLEYNPTASFVEIVFRCPKCDSVCTAQLSVPAPDFTAETHHDSVNVEYDECYCEKCDSSFSVELSTGFYGGMCELCDVEDVLDFKEIYETTAGATITSHCGEHTLGILYINDGK